MMFTASITALSVLCPTLVCAGTDTAALARASRHHRRHLNTMFEVDPVRRGQRFDVL